MKKSYQPMSTRCRCRMKTPITPTDAPRPVDHLWIIPWYTFRARISSYASFTFTKKVRKGVSSVKPAHLNSTPPSDEDPEHTIRRAMNRRSTLHHTMVYVSDKSLNLRPFFRHELGVDRCEEVIPAHVNSMPVSDEDPNHTNRRPATRRPPLDHTMVYVPVRVSSYAPFMF